VFCLALCKKAQYVVVSHFGNQLGIWLSTTNPLRLKAKWSLIGACDTLLERCFWGL
jgi:hypothetical protein